jgi:hypothetical protein
MFSQPIGDPIVFYVNPQMPLLLPSSSPAHHRLPERLLSPNDPAKCSPRPEPPPAYPHGMTMNVPEQGQMHQFEIILRCMFLMDSSKSVFQDSTQTPPPQPPPIPIPRKIVCSWVSKGPPFFSGLFRPYFTPSSSVLEDMGL